MSPNCGNSGDSLPNSPELNLPEFGSTLEVNDFTGCFVERCPVLLVIIYTQTDVDDILLHRRLRFCFMIGALQLTNLRHPSLMAALGSAK